MKGLWHHQPKDEYVVITTRVVSTSSAAGREPKMRGFRLVRETDNEHHKTLADAKSHGFDIQGSDDFNIGAIRHGTLEALLWMDEITDDDPAIMQKVVSETAITA